MEKRNFTFRYLLLLCILGLFYHCSLIEKPASERNLLRASETLDSILKYYSVPKSNMYLEDYYLENEASNHSGNADMQRFDPRFYAHLYPYTGFFSSLNVLIKTTNQDKYKILLQSSIMPGLNDYYDTTRKPFGYASFIKNKDGNFPDRFYNDNIDLGIYFLEAYSIFKKQEYLDQALRIWELVQSGMDEKTGGGIYWCEQQKESKNACSNTSGAVFALKLLEVTKNKFYYLQGKKLYDWTRDHLQDQSDHLFYDNIRLDGTLEKSKYSYNSGQMMQAAVMLFNQSGDSTYLIEAQVIAKSCYQYFFYDYQKPEKKTVKLLRKGSVWFSAILLRGYIDLYRVDHNRIYVDAFQQNLDYVWKHGRDKNGLFSTDWTGKTQDPRKWVLSQTAFVEMYARMSSIK